MSQIMKKVLCSFLAVLMIMGAAPVNAIALELEPVGESVAVPEVEENVYASEREGNTDAQVIGESFDHLETAEYGTTVDVLSTKNESMETGVYQRILEVQKEMEKVLPNGYWSEDGKTHSDGYNYGYLETMVEDVFKDEDWVKKGYLTSSQYECWSCFAFARFVFVKVFGGFKDKYQPIPSNTYPANKASSYDNLKTGDMFYTTVRPGVQHCMIYLWHDSTGVTVMDGNGDGKATINYGKKYNYADGGNLNGYLEVYRANNWDEIDKKYGHNYDKYGYCSRCGKYYEEINKVTSIEGTATSTGTIYVKPHPYAGDSGANQDELKAGTYNIIGKIENHYGNTWYKISYSSSKTGWVYPEENVTIDIKNTFDFDLHMNTYSIPKGSSVWANDSSAKYNWYGKVSSSNGVSKITSVTFEILKSDGSLSASSNRITKKPNAVSYTVSTSDDTMKFSELAVGEYFLSLSATDEHGNSASQQIGFTITNGSSTTVPVTGVTLDYASIHMGKGSKSTLVATVSPSNATNKNVTWSSSNTSVATVSSSGVVTGVDAGEAVITVKTADGGYKATCYVYISGNVCRVTYDLNGGEANISNVDVEEGTYITLPEEIPFRPGYNFMGWQTTGTAEGEWTTAKPSTGNYETGYKYYVYGYEYKSDYTYVCGTDKSNLIAHVKENSSIFGTYTPSKLRYFYMIESSDKGDSFYPGQSGSNYNYFDVDYIAEDGKTGTASIYKTPFYFESKVYKQDAAVAVIYQPGDSYLVTKDTVFTALWEEEPPTIILDSFACTPNCTTRFSVYIENNDATENLSFDFDFVYDKTAFEIESIETFFPEDGVVEVNGDNVKYEVVNGETGAFSGVFATVVLKIKDAEIKDYVFTIKVNKWVNGFGNVEPKIVDGIITINHSDCVVHYYSPVECDLPEDKVYEYGDEIIIADAPEDEDWEFVYWSDDNGIKYYPGERVKLVDSYFYLQANWKPKWTPVITVENASGAPGETIAIPVNITNNLHSENTSIYVLIDTGNAIYQDFKGVQGLPVNGNIGTIYVKIPETAKNGDSYTISAVPTTFSVFEEHGVIEIFEYVQTKTGVLTVKEPEKATYTVTYNANGGSGAPASQTKTEGKALTLSTAKPTRSGYTFLGWATSSSATSAQYQPGDSYTKDANITLYAVWKKSENQKTADIVIDDVSGKTGEEITVTVFIENNPGISVLNLPIEYDKNILEKVSFEGQGLDGSWQYGTNATWVGENSSYNGAILIMKFKIKDTAEEGTTAISIFSAEAFDENENEVLLNITNGNVKIVNSIPGDVTGDGKVNSLDLLRLHKFIAGINVEVDVSAADVTGDGKVNSLDLLRLHKYIAGMDVELK